MAFRLLRRSRFVAWLELVALGVPRRKPSNDRLAESRLTPQRSITGHGKTILRSK
jgi:hypothetical protein